MKAKQTRITISILFWLALAFIPTASATGPESQPDLFNAVYAGINEVKAPVTVKPIIKITSSVAPATVIKVAVAASTISIKNLHTGATASTSISIASQIKQLENLIKSNDYLINSYQSNLAGYVRAKELLIETYEARIKASPRALDEKIRFYRQECEKACADYLDQQKQAQAKVKDIARLYDSLIEYQVEQKAIEPARSVAINRIISRLNQQKEQLCNYYKTRADALTAKISQLKASTENAITVSRNYFTALNRQLNNRISALRSDIALITKSVTRTIERLADKTKELAATVEQLKKQQQESAGSSGGAADGPNLSSVTGELQCLELTASSSRILYTEEPLTFSLENFYARYVASGALIIRNNPEVVKKWNWQSAAGKFDERRSLETSLPVNRRVWHAPANPGWYNVECGVDVLGDGKLVATFSRKVYINEKVVAPPPASHSMNIIGRNPIPGVVISATQIRFSQTFSVETTMNSKITWLTSNGTITGDGKVATWTFVCTINSIPSFVSVTCLTRFNDQDFRSARNFTLSRTAAEDFQNGAEAAKNCDPARILGYLKDLGVTIDNPLKSDGIPELWSKEQLYYAWKTIVSLPRGVSESLKNIKRVSHYNGNQFVLGYVYAGFPTVYMCNSSTTGGRFEDTLVHEIAHAWYFDKKNLEARKNWDSTFWSNGKLATNIAEQPVSSYGNTNVHEDFAEACKVYWLNSPNMKSNNPLRYAFMKNQVFKMEYPESNPTSKVSIASKE